MASSRDSKTAAFIQKNLRCNFSVNLWDITFIPISLSLVSHEAVMPVLVNQLMEPGSEWTLNLALAKTHMSSIRIVCSTGVKTRLTHFDVNQYSSMTTGRLVNTNL